MNVYRRRRVSAESKAAASSSSSTPGRWCAARRLQRNVIRFFEHGHIRDLDVPHDCDVRIAPGQRAPQSRATYTTDHDDAAADRTEVPNGQRRRAPNHTATVLRISPADRRGHTNHRRCA